MNASDVITLLPHQQAFVEQVLQRNAGIVVLSGPVGLGKSTALLALAARVLASRSESRVLFLVPSALVPQLAERGQRLGMTTRAIDRYRFRELLDQESKNDMWSTGCLYVMGFDFARQPDVLDALCASAWELLVVDEAHQVRGQRAEALNRLLPKSKQVALASATLNRDDISHPLRDALVIEWPAEVLGATLARGSNRWDSVTVRSVTYELSHDERELEQAVQRLVDALRPSDEWVADLVRHSAESSALALLYTIQVLDEGLGPEDGAPSAQELLLDTPPTEEGGRELKQGLAPETVEAMDIAAERALTLEEDRKLEALWEALPDTDAERRICVVVEFGATLSYLETALSDRGLPVAVVTRMASPQHRQQALELFKTDGRILIATWGALRGGIEPDKVTDLVFYDTPRSEAARQELVTACRPLDAAGVLSVALLVRHE